jgi:hypothetical protein
MGISKGASDVVSSMCFVVAIASAKYIVRLCSPQRLLRLPLSVPVFVSDPFRQPFKSFSRCSTLHILFPSVLFSLYILLLAANAVVTPGESAHFVQDWIPRKFSDTPSVKC